jgi:hypothetical protein
MAKTAERFLPLPREQKKHKKIIAKKICCIYTSAA